jgi:hypothetical protein
MDQGMTALETVINQNLDDLSALAYNDKDREKLAKETVELYRVKNEETKNDNTYWENKDRLEQERKLQEKEQELKAQEMELKANEISQRKKQSWLDAGIKAVSLIAGIGMSFAVMKFEETGTIRSKAWPGFPKMKF